MRNLLLPMVAAAALWACKSSDHDAPSTTGPVALPTKGKVEDQEVKRALILSSALDKAKQELTALETAEPRDEKAIEVQKQKIQAVSQTLGEINHRLEQRDRERRRSP